MGVVGRYIFNPLIFEYIRKTSKGSGGEIQLTDAIDLMLKKKKFMHTSSKVKDMIVASLAF